MKSTTLFHIFSVPALLWVLSGMASADQAMTFETRCAGNAVESCYVVATGTIQPDTAQQFKDFYEAFLHEGNRVLFDSQGGDLAAGMALGRLIREKQFETRVGRWDIDALWGDAVDDTECSSACAYAFLGGTIRQVPEGNRLGFHQFYLDASMVPVQVAGSALVQVMAETQRLSGDIVFYLIEMGVDARLFSLGSQTEQAGMIYPDPQQMLDFDLVTPLGYGPFFLEPFRDGIVAASRRIGPTRAYDEMTQLTALCRGGVPSLLVSARNSIEHFEPAVFELHDGREFEVGHDDMIARGERAVEITLTSNQASALVSTEAFDVIIRRQRWAGGNVAGRFKLQEMDRKMIASAFRHCI
ncbi:MAG: hypothetical protein JJU07_12410 [Natronohydrobacter sp.]|nr:hypothetical protein [Natronohydrobacter sp.]